jgi:hypothetical protein
MEITPEVIRKYGTANPVLMLARDNHDPYDEFAWVQGWRFAIADKLTFDKGEDVPDFTPSPFGPDTDSFEYAALCETFHTVETLWYALKILDRYREWLRAAGKDY